MTDDSVKAVHALGEMFADVGLHPDLRPYLRTEGEAKALRHPLMSQVPYFEQLNKLCNDAYTGKKSLLDLCLRELQFEDAIWLHEREFRLDALLAYRPYMKDPVFWQVVGQVFVDTEDVQSNLNKWASLLTPPRHARKMMKMGEQHAWNKLPPMVTLYRGTQRAEVTSQFKGVSWSLSQKVAMQFAMRFMESDPVMLECQVSKEKISAVLDRRDEQEVLVAPQFISTVKVWNLERKKHEDADGGNPAPVGRPAGEAGERTADGGADVHQGPAEAAP